VGGGPGWQRRADGSGKGGCLNLSTVEIARGVVVFVVAFLVVAGMVVLLSRSLWRRAVVWTPVAGRAGLTPAEEIAVGVGRRARSVGLCFLFPLMMFGLMLGVNLSSGVAWSDVLVPVASGAGMATASLMFALVMMGVLPQRAGVVLADRVRLSVPGMLGTREKIYPWARAELASLDVVEDLSVVVVRADGVSSCLVVDRVSLEAMRGFKAGAA
jgi:hypothetical protein